MKTKKTSTILFMALALMLCSTDVTVVASVGTSFTYQGRLIDANEVADGLYDFQFKLYDANGGGNKLGVDANKSDVDVIDGYFTVELDFGSVFDGNERWLEIGVRPGDLDDPNVYTLLSPRQAITPAPYALYAAGGSGGESLWQVSGSDIYYNNGNIGIGTSTPDQRLTVNDGTIKASTSLSTGKSVEGVASNSGDYSNYGAILRQQVAGVGVSTATRVRPAIAPTTAATFRQMATMVVASTAWQ
jgi:hypothetical protein